MTLFLSIEVDEPVRVGESFTATVLVEATKEHDIDGLSLTLEGVHWIGASDDGMARFACGKVDLLDATRITPGRHRYRADLQLAADLPPTMSGSAMHYELTAKAVIPWWFDVTGTRELRVVLPPPGERPAPQPATATSDERGLHALFLELTLDDTVFAPGESITGSFSVGNTKGVRLDGAVVAVVARHGAVSGAFGGDNTVWKSLVGADEGSVVHFSIPIPEGTPPSCSTRIGDIERDVRLRVDGYGTSCSIPITIGDYERRAGGEGDHEAAGPTGGVRWRFAWRDEGARHGLALDGNGLRLRGTLAGEVSAKVRAQGIGMGATLRWESLGIGLDVVRRGLNPFTGVDLYPVHPRIADRFTVRGREDAQVEALFRDSELCAALLALDEVTIDDEGARLGSESPARDAEALGGFLDALDQLARAIVAAVPRLPPPAWTTPGMVNAWRRYATSTGARLSPGRMVLTGALADGDRVDLATHLDKHGAPASTRLTLALDPPLARDAPEGVGAEVLRAVADPERAPALKIGVDEMVLTLAGRVEDPESLRAPIAEMQRLAQRLRGDTARGPYR